MKTRRLLSALALCLAAVPAFAADAPQCPAVEKFAPGVISTDEHWEWRLTFTPTRLRAYWATSVGWWPGTREQAVIKTSYWRLGGGWTQPTVASFSGVHSDFDPFVSPDGLTLYFSSMRPVDGHEKGDMDLWMVRRTLHGWSDPVHLGHDVNADGYDELYSSIDLWGNLYFARVKAPIPTEDVEIWRSKRRSDGSFGPAEKLGAGVNTARRWEFNPEISPDGRTLLFARLDLPDDGLPDQGHGFGDLYVSRLRHGEFGVAQNLGPCVNSAADEFHPTVLWERDMLYFARDIGVPSDFYRTPLQLPR
ncbi:WD40 repeat protein [Luteimonas cucumeris]|uniref:WD40 repeat protein n=1 Tax=Luteimonas cucumeris TaxID=985012 RepID=A0A562LBD1_9GAMM|nr:PD40 domain-containing protein [Luteimonas cucumeris]TWI04982.1 WD40 repeat protein [Luteimonas cucumeris]